MELELRINGIVKSLDGASNESLMTVLRREGYASVKHGCETGECGACTVLVDGLPRPSCVMLAAQAGGCTLITAESLGYVLDKGVALDKSGLYRKLHPLQEAFIDSGAIQCGFCTPGMLLSAYALLRQNAHPTEDDVRDALSGNLCRCTGYVKPVQAVMRAAAIMRGERIPPINDSDTENVVAPLVGTRARSGLRIVGKSEHKVDAVKLVTGKPVFVDDIELRDMLHGRLLTSPYAHARIRSIDVSQAQALPGVNAVLTYKDVKRVPHTTAGQSWFGSEEGPHDQYCLDSTVRFVGDRVAAVAAETPETAEQALGLIRVDYEILPAVLDLRQAMEPGAPCLHAEKDSYGIYNASRNVAAQIRAEVGNVEHGFAESDLVIEGEYIVPQVQQTPIENHIVITYWDQDDRLVVRSSTEVPQQVRRIIAPLIGLPPRRIRVVKPRVGGSFGAKQDVVLEDICALLTIATNRPVKLELSRAEEFRSSRSLHAHVVRMKTGVKRDGTIVANAMIVLANTGAYGIHALSVLNNTALQTLPLYACPNMRFAAQAVYTNVPPAGAFGGYGTSQGFFALESQMDEVAQQLGMDALELRRKNWLTAGHENPLARALAGAEKTGKGRAAGHGHAIESCGLPQCLQIVEEKLAWKEKRGRNHTGRFRRGVGIALAMHGSAGSGMEMSEASVKLNEDGSFNLLVGAADAGSGSDTLLTQVAAEVLGVRMADIILPSSDTADTDHMPFDSGGCASPYVSGNAVKRAAEQVRRQILAVAGRMLNTRPETLTIEDGMITAPNGEKVTLAQVALHSLYVENRPQIMATASWASNGQPPSFAAQGVEVEVDTETGEVRILKAISAVDVGHVINPAIAEGQVEGGAAQALGYAVCEEMVYDQQGALLTTRFGDYRIHSATDIPPMETSMVESGDAVDPFGARAVTEIALEGIAPAVANAVADALGIRMWQLPLAPERVLRAIHAAAAKH